MEELNVKEIVEDFVEKITEIKGQSRLYLSLPTIPVVALCKYCPLNMSFCNKKYRYSEFNSDGKYNFFLEVRYRFLDGHLVLSICKCSGTDTCFSIIKEVIIDLNDYSSFTKLSGELPLAVFGNTYVYSC